MLSKLGFIVISASNSSDDAKKSSDFVCTGKNDEKVIQKALDICVKESKNIFLHNGTYFIEDFYSFEDGGPDSALVVPQFKGEIAIIGQNHNMGKTSGVIWYVPKTALDKVGKDGADVIRTAWSERGILSGRALRFENIAIKLSHNQSPVRCIDLRRCDRPEIKNVNLTAYADMNAGFGKPPIPAVEGCIGITMTDGSNSGFSSVTHMAISGFYEGMQVGGEHVLITNVGAIMNVYGFTFGNYPLNCGANHPIRLVQCYDERNINLPLFNSCGDSDGKGGRLHGLQEVSMVSFNIERIAEQTPGGKLGDCMREVIPGSFRGNIDFTAQPAWCHLNEINFKLWEDDGSGTGFVTRNNCHKTVCTTAERLSYYPMHGQKVFDTDLNKEVICIDCKNKKWVDLLGNEV
jgi:hypothetical protein